MVELSTEKIRGEILKTGFPLELRTAALLQERDFRVAHSLYYVDADEGKGREMDLRALRNLRSTPSSPRWIRFVLMVECKRLDKPWVVLASPATSYDKSIAEIDVLGLPQTKRIPRPHLTLNSEELDRIAAMHPYFNSPMRGRSYFEAFKDGGDSSGRIFGALTTSVKATVAMRADKFAAAGAGVCFYYPLIVVDGRIFQGSLRDDQIEVEEVEKVIVSFSYTSPNYVDEQFLVPIVRFDHLSAFVDELESAHEQLAELVERDKRANGVSARG